MKSRSSLFFFCYLLFIYVIYLSNIVGRYIHLIYSLHRYNSDFIVSIKNLIAPPKCKVKAVAKQIKMQHAALEGVEVADCKCWFVKLWSSLELFGMEVLSCTNIDTKEKGLIGVSKDKVSCGRLLFSNSISNTFKMIFMFWYTTEAVLMPCGLI